MKVSIDLLGQKPSIAELIHSSTEMLLSENSIGILEFCQSMSSECWTGYVDSKLICCWGLIPPTLLSNQAYLWMHCTPDIRDHKFLLVRHSQIVVAKMLERYPRIVGDCLLDASDSIRWLKWLGATFGEPQGAYIPFVIRKKLNG